jgi:predicted metal-binding membrane protein
MGPVLTWAWAGNWALMMVAMMLPTLVPPLCYVHSRSFARRRVRAMGLFVAGYGAVWLAVGSALLGLQLLAQWATVNLYLPVVVAGLLALVWQASPLKQRCLNRGHRHRALAAFGFRADWDALRLGLEHGGWCAASCWALMLVPLLLPHGHLLAMAVVGLLMFCERMDPPTQPAWGWRGFKTALGYGRLRLLRLRSTTASTLA